MSPKLQVKLLRVLEDGRFEPVGSVVTQQVDVRIIAATNRALDEAVAAKQFREDLFYRLRVEPIKLLAHLQRQGDHPRPVAGLLGAPPRNGRPRVDAAPPAPEPPPRDPSPGRLPRARHRP